MTIDMLVTGLDEAGHPMGYLVSEDIEYRYKWTIDDEYAILIHPIVSERTLGTVHSVTT